MSRTIRRTDGHTLMRGCIYKQHDDLEPDLVKYRISIHYTVVSSLGPLVGTQILHLFFNGFNGVKYIAQKVALAGRKKKSMFQR